jgi:glycosyltransferase involved in cell wall biosynthesis
MIDCTVLIMTYNEESNIEKCLKSLIGNFKRICIVDSYSTDETLRIIKEYPSVEVYENEFESWGVQRNWLFCQANVSTEFVLFLDADESLGPSLVREISDLINTNTADVGRFHVLNKFLGREIKYAYGHPSITRLFRTSLSPEYTSEGAREYVAVLGVEVQFVAPLLHEDLKPLKSWLRKHINNATREAEYLNGSKKIESGGSLKNFIRVEIWQRLPIFFRPLLYFSYRYFFRLGVLDGTAGFVFCFFQALAYQMTISAMIYESQLPDSNTAHKL